MNRGALCGVKLMHLRNSETPELLRYFLRDVDVRLEGLADPRVRRTLLWECILGAKFHARSLTYTSRKYKRTSRTSNAQQNGTV